MKSKKSLLRSAFTDTLPILTGYLSSGFAMGLLAEKSGYPWWIVMIMSLLLYAGAMQFVAIDFFISGMGFVEIALMTFVVQSRHMFYGLSLVDRYKNNWARKPYMIHSLTDETYALLFTSKAPEGVSRGEYDLVISGMDHAYWFSGCMLGALAGGFLPFDLVGLDFALPALFIASCVEQWHQAPSKRPALIGLGSGILFLFLFGPQNFLLPAVFAAIALLFAMRKPIEKSFCEQASNSEKSSKASLSENPKDNSRKNSEAKSRNRKGEKLDAGSVR